MVSDKKNILSGQFPVKKNLKKASQQINGARSKRKYLIPAVLFFLCFLLYGNTLCNDYAGDDFIYTYQNEFIIKGFSAFKDIFDKASLYGLNKQNEGSYRPLPLLNFMAETSLFGFNPHVSHFFNVLFFAFTIVLLYFFLQKILKNYNQVIIIAATLLFAFHPIHTEVVANIKSRDEILALLFGLISFYFIMLHQDRNKKSYYFFSLGAFFAALFCKESVLTFVAIIPLLLYFFTSLEIKKIALKTIPYMGMTVIYLLIRIHVLQNITFSTKISIIQNALMAAKNGSEMTATSFVLLGKYIYMTIIPYPLSCDYSYRQIPIVSWGNSKAILSLLVSAFMVGYMFWGTRKKSIYSFLIALFFITLLLSSSLIIKIACTFGERFLYVPSLSFCIALPILAAKALKFDALQLTWQKKIKFYIPVACLLIIYTIIVIPRNAQWKNDFTIVYAGVITSPNSALAHGALADLYMDSAQNSHDTAKRIHYYSLAIHENTRATEILSMSDWYYNLGICYSAKGKEDSAIIAYKKAMKTDTTCYLAANNLGVLYINMAQYDSALTYLTMAYRVDTGLYTLLNIAMSYQNIKNFGLALHFDSLALKKDPGNKPALASMYGIYTGLGVEYFNNNKLDTALQEFSLALNSDSTSATNFENIGVVYSKMGNIEKAKAYYEKALSMDPKNETYLKNMQLLTAGTRN